LSCRVLLEEAGCGLRQQVHVHQPRSNTRFQPDLVHPHRLPSASSATVYHPKQRRKKRAKNKQRNRRRVALFKQNWRCFVVGGLHCMQTQHRLMLTHTRRARPAAFQRHRVNHPSDFFRRSRAEAGRFYKPLKSCRVMKWALRAYANGSHLHLSPVSASRMICPPIPTPNLLAVGHNAPHPPSPLLPWYAKPLILMYRPVHGSCAGG
jgi:hypothetical protein